MKRLLPLMLCAFIAFAAGCCERGTAGTPQADAGVEMVFRCPAAFGPGFMGGHGIIDITGKTIVEPKYDSIEIHEKVLLVSLNGLYGLLGSDGRELAPRIYRRAVIGRERYPVGYSHAMIEPEPEMLPFALLTEPCRANAGAPDAAFKLDGTPLCGEQVTHCDIVCEKFLVATKSDGKKQVYDANGNRLYNGEFDGYCKVGEAPQVALVKGGKYFLFNLETHHLSDVAVDDVGEFSEGMSAVKIGGKWGFVDAQGALAVPARFAKVSVFREGLCAAAISSAKDDSQSKVEPALLWGFIGKSGEFLIPPTYHNTESFHGGVARVQKVPSENQPEDWQYITFAGEAIPVGREEEYRREEICEGVSYLSGKKLVWSKTGKVICDDCWMPYYDADTGLVFFTGSRWASFADPRTGFVLDESEIGVEEIKAWSEGLLVGRSGDSACILDYQGNQIGPEYERVDRLYDGRAKFRIKDSKAYGYLDEKGNVAIPPAFPTALKFSNGLAAVRGSGWGYIDRAGQWVIEPKYDMASGFDGGLASVKLGEKWGVIDARGQQILPCEDRFVQFFDGIGLLVVDAKWGALDETGRTVIEPLFDSMSDFADGYAIVSLGDLWGSIDTAGNYIIPPKYRRLERLGEGILSYEGVGRWGNTLYGLMTDSGRIVCEPEFWSVFAGVSDGLIAVSVDSVSDVNAGFVDTTGKWVVTPRFLFASHFSEGRSRVDVETDYNEDAWGFCDREGKLVVPPRYSYVWDFHDGRAKVQNGGLFGYIDPQGNEVIPLRYRNAEDFAGGHAVAYTEDEAFILDTAGNAFRIKESSLEEQVSNGFVAESREEGSYNLKGVLGFTGSWIIAPQFRKLAASKKGYPLFGVKDGRCCAVDEAGTVTFEEDWTDALRRASRCFVTKYVEGEGHCVFDLFENRVFSWPYYLGGVYEVPLRRGASAERKSRSKAREK
ncbi:MAG: WG repeat-containing protein [Candidatus Brocadiia bacterium]